MEAPSETEVDLENFWFWDWMVSIICIRRYCHRCCSCCGLCSWVCSLWCSCCWCAWSRRSCCVEEDWISLLILHLTYSVTRVFKLIEIPNPVNEDRRTERMALTLSYKSKKGVRYSKFCLPAPKWHKSYLDNFSIRKRKEKVRWNNFSFPS